ncbi:MAG: MFS transporter, partial [Pirellulales bacterium]
LAGYRRKSYLMITTATASLGFTVLAMQPWGTVPHYQLLLAMLMLPAVGMAFSDVVIDGLMVETGQPLGLTGRLQSVQWTSLYVAGFIMSWLAGYLTGQKQYRLVMALCAAGPAVACLVTVLFVREKPLRGVRQGEHFRAALANFIAAARSPLVFCVGGFLVLWNFNPFADTIQQLHVTKVLKLEQEFYGRMEAAYAIAAATGCLMYGLYCRRIRMTRLVHISIVLGIFSTLSYWFMHDKPSALAVSIAAGFAAATATMIQLDLAARIVPAAVAGTVFALLMSLANLGSGFSPGVGGTIYDMIEPSRGPYAAYNILVAIGACCTACCWFLTPGLQRLIRQAGPVKPGTPGAPPSLPTVE